MYRMLYPDDRYVTEAFIRGCLSDAKANDELDNIYEELNPYGCSVAVAMKALEECGKFTFEAPQGYVAPYTERYQFDG